MNNFITRLLQRFRGNNTASIPGEYRGSRPNETIAPAFDYTMSNDRTDEGTDPSAEFESFNDGDFSGAGAGDSWTDSGAGDGGDPGGGDGGGGDSGGGDGGGGGSD